MKPAPFEIPHLIRIRGRDWLVLRARDLGDDKYDRAAKRVLRTSLGVTYYLTKRERAQGKIAPREIHLKSHLNRRSDAQTFLHELLHACSRQRVSPKVEERFIRDVEHALLDVLEQIVWVPARGRKAARARR